MSKYIRYYNNNDIERWAEQTLNAEELIQFNLDFEENSNLWKSYIDNGLITVNPMVESVYISEFNEHVQIEVGHEVVLSNGVTPSQIPMTHNWGNWLNRFAIETNMSSIIFET